jgi:hypothetical protein
MRPCKNGSIDIALSRQVLGSAPRGVWRFVTFLQSNIGETKKFVLEQTRGVGIGSVLNGNCETSRIDPRL